MAVGEVLESPEREDHRHAALRGIRNPEEPIGLVLPLVHGCEIHALRREAEAARVFLGELAHVVPVLLEARPAPEGKTGPDDALLEKNIEDRPEVEVAPLAV